VLYLELCGSLSFWTSQDVPIIGTYDTAEPPRLHNWRNVPTYMCVAAPEPDSLSVVLCVWLRGTPLFRSSFPDY